MVDFGTERGIYEQSFSLSLTTPLPGGTIRYTLDGTPPSAIGGTLYTGPLTISTTSYVRAVAYNADTTSRIFTHTYLFLADVVNQPNTVAGYPAGNLALDGSLKNDPVYGPQLLEGLLAIPSISLVMSPADLNTTYGGGTEVPVSMELIYPDGRPSIQENCGIKRVGGSSYNSLKRNWRLTFRSQYGAGKLRAEIFDLGGTDEHDQIALRPGYHGCIIRDEGKDINDQLLRNLQIYMDPDSIGIHGFFAHLYVNGIYWGVYNPSERGNNGFGEAYYGGNKDDFDAIKRKQAMDGNLTAWNTLNTMVNTLDMSIPQHYQDVQNYIDVRQFIDYVIVCNYGPHADAHISGKNSFVTRDRTKTEGFRFFVWDSEPALWSTWRWTNSTHEVPPYNNIWYALLNNPDFRMQVADQLYHHCFHGGILTPDFVAAEYTRLFDHTLQPFIGEAARWKDKTIYEKLFAERDSNLLSYIPNRTQVLVNTYRIHGNYPMLDAVDFSQHGGQFSTDMQLSLSHPNAQGAIYYTLDGTDPRSPGGGISSQAQLYTGAIGLPSAVVDVRARVLHNGVWSASWPVRFYPEQDYSGLVINEIHYHPADTCGTEFIELKNAGADTLDLTDVQFTTGLRYSFPYGTVLAPDSFLVLANHLDSFLLAYGFLPAGQYRGKLDNGGEELILVDPLGGVIDSLRYNDVFPWDSLADGHGPSLELLNSDFDNALAPHWRASVPHCGSPGATNTRFCASLPDPLVMTEIMYNYGFRLDGLDAQDWIELYNPAPYAVDLSGWQLIDGDSLLLIPGGTSIAAGEYLVLCDSLNDFVYAHPTVANVVSLPGLRLSSKGEGISLLDEAHCPVTFLLYDNQSPWPKAADGKGFSLQLIDPGLDPHDPAHWTVSDNYGGTPGRPNLISCSPIPYTAVPHNPIPTTYLPIVLNEIVYRANPAFDTQDWVELYNPNPYAVDLTGWELHDANNYYTLSPGTILPANGYWVLAQDLSSFQALYPWVQNVSGNWGFGLSGDGEWVALLTNDRCWVDGLKYNDSPPWPVEPDGQGPTLSLIDPALDNALAGSWAPSTWGNAPLGTPAAPNNIPAPCPPASLPNTAVPYTQITINEILYHSDPAFDTGNWLELYNPTDSTVDLSHWMLVDQDSVYTLPGATLMGPHSFLVLAENDTSAKLLNQMSPALPVGPTGLNFNNKGERLLLYTAGRCLVDSVDYEDEAPWPVGKEIDPIVALLDPALDNAQGENWLAAAGLGSPGRANLWPCQPGGGELDLRLWLQADLTQSNGSSVSLWPDASGLGHDATQLIAGDEPRYYADQLNGHGIVRFDGTQDWLKINALAGTLSGESTIFAVLTPEADTDVGYYLSSHLGGSNRLKVGHRVNGELTYDDDVPSLSTGNFLGKATMTAFHVTPGVVSGLYNGIAGTPWTNPTLTGADRASIGQEYDGGGGDQETSNHWKGDLAEMIIFGEGFSTAERNAVETYLNIKYGITIPVSSHTRYPYSDFPYRLAGIGQDIHQCLDQSVSQSQEPGTILRISAAGERKQGGFLVWGDNGQSVDSSAAVSFVPPEIASRTDRIWRLARTGSVGEVLLFFDLQGHGWDAVDPRAFVLLVDDDGNFNDARIVDADTTGPLHFRLDPADGDYLSLGLREYSLISARAILSGAYETANQLMRDDLYQQNLLPATDPYAASWDLVPVNLEPANLALAGPNAPVDWVLLELCAADDSATVVHRQAFLLQRDGDLMDARGDTNLLIAYPAGSYYLSIRHRNHLGVMTAAPYALSVDPTVYDFRILATFGSFAQKEVGLGLKGLWAGDANGDGKIIFQGTGNDLGPIFLEVLNASGNTSYIRNFVVMGYQETDTNLDGQVIFQGIGSDLNAIFLNVLSHPQNQTSYIRNFVVQQQTP